MWSVSINRHTPEKPFQFEDLIRLQALRLSELRRSGASELIFAELPPTLTLGARQWLGQGEPLQMRVPPGVQVVPGERGGNETWHGPGQWVGFVLTPLEAFVGDPKGVRRAVHRMLELLLPTVRRYVADARMEEGARLGLWSGFGKLASIGIKIREGYTSSGFALNCIPRAEAFRGIHPCGIAGASPDFLFRTSVRPEFWPEEFARIPHQIWDDFKNS